MAISRCSPQNKLDMLSDKSSGKSPAFHYYHLTQINMTETQSAMTPYQRSQSTNPETIQGTHELQ